ncbi:hypothetical protein EDD85DRAFT_952292 [Armillaria nabsnona]|nr:hypothetical protein EDD85DRAFT_952292 [Armillaria nabsnona]
MNPDLTLIQTITIGVTIAIVTLLITVLLLTLTYAYKQDSQGPTSAPPPSLDTMSNQQSPYDPRGEFTEFPTNREDIPRNATLGPSNTRRTPTPGPEPVQTECLRVTNPDDPWGPAEAPSANDPDYPTGTWSSATEHERFRNWDQPVAVLDTPYEPESFDPVPPYFTARALLAPRACKQELNTSFRTGLPDRPGTIPFPVSGGIRLR